MKKHVEKEIRITSTASDNAKGERRRKRLLRKIRRKESISYIKKNPLKLLYFPLLGGIFYLMRQGVIKLYKFILLKTEEILSFWLIAEITSSITEIETVSILKYFYNVLLEELPIFQNWGLYILNTFFMFIFLNVIWKNLLPWIGRPNIEKSELLDIEAGIAKTLGFSEKKSRYYDRPMIKKVTYGVNGSEIDEYIFYSPLYSAKKLNESAIQSEILHILGGKSKDGFYEKPVKIQNYSLLSRVWRKTFFYRRKQKFLNNLIYVRISPNEPTREELIDDEI